MSKKEQKSQVNAAWHTHLYRACKGIVRKSNKPWHTHLYRAFNSFCGDPRYTPRLIKNGYSLMDISWDRFNKEILLNIKRYKGVYIQEFAIDWNVPLYQRPQHMACALGRANYLVIYKTSNEFDNVNGFREVATNVWITNHSEVDGIPGAVRNFCSTSHWWTPEILKSKQKHGPIVYEYIDHIDPAISGDGENIRRLTALKEYVFNGGANCIVSSAKRLHEEVNHVAFSENKILVPNGVDTTHYRSPVHKETLVDEKYLEFLKRHKNIIGYFGAIAPWLYYECIEALAKIRPDLGFVFIGPDYNGGAQLLPKRENVYYAGVVPYNILPAYAMKFDVCFIPFSPGEIAKTTSPLKLFEYFALEKPVVTTTDMLECVAFKEVFHGNSADEFSLAINQALAVKDDANLKKQYAKLADANSWDVRAANLAKVISKLK